MDEVDKELALIEERGAKHSEIGLDLLQHEIGGLCGRPAETLDVSATVGDAIDTMQAGRFGAVVITKDGKLVGILTERDLLMKVLGKIDDYRTRPIDELMTANPESLRKEDELVYLMNAMRMGGFRHMPIVDDQGTPLHVVSVRDVLAHVLEQFADEIKNIPPGPYRGERKQYSG